MAQTHPIYQKYPLPNTQLLNARSLTQTPTQISSPNTQLIPPHSMSDYEFFKSLKMYTPWPCYSGKGSPLILINKGWFMGFGCLLILDAIYLLVIFMLLSRAQEGLRPLPVDKVNQFTIMCWTMFGLINFFYFTTQFLNPGIRNLSKITPQQYKKDGQFFCSRCNGNRTRKMQHCTDCQVCIDGLDHHCGFFGKCIGGCQKFFFFGFLAVVGLGFVVLIWTAMSSSGF